MNERFFVYYHNEAPLVNESLSARNYLEKHAGLFTWFKDIKNRRNKKKTIKIIKSQASNRKTVHFNYTNLKNETKAREIEPYELKDGYLWGFDRSDPNGNIKKFFVSKLKDVKPGQTEFTPRWEVKIAEMNEKVAGKLSIMLRNPKFLRFAEPVIGGTVGAGIGYSQTAGEPETERILAAVAGGTAGAVGAKLLSWSIRKAAPLRGIEKSQERLWARTGGKIIPDWKTRQPGIAGRYPARLLRENTIKELRKEHANLNRKGGLKKLKESLVPNAQRRVLGDALAPNIKDMKTLPLNEQKAYIRGYYGNKRPKFYTKGRPAELVAGEEKRFFLEISSSISIPLRRNSLKE